MGNTSRFWLISIASVAGLGCMLYLVALYGMPDREHLGDNPGITMTAVALGTLVSEDLSTITSGLLAGTGVLEYWQAVLAAFCGILLGDSIIFFLGYHFGRPLLAHRWSRFIVRRKAVDRAQNHFHRNGLWIILLTRFLPGTRTATYFAAGALHAPVIPFISAFALAAALWTPLLVGLSFFLGRELLDFYRVYESMALPAVILVGLLLYLLVHYGLPLLTWKGRRRIKGKWIRAVKWEFWPAWQVYWLVLIYVLLIGIFRFRNPLLFTAANPAMPDGGVIGESKSDILDGLSSNPELMPPWGLIEAGDKNKRLGDFDRLMQSLNLTYPVVLKPDEGQRGDGVRIVRAHGEACDWLASNPGDAILQAYLDGQEYGIFYARKPSQERGIIISVTVKKQLQIEGNGKDTIETLIHAHPRAIAMLGTFLDRFDMQLERIPASGEIVRLGELGTHARGSLFIDGNELISEPLRARIQEIADCFDGFYFGRFDIKAPSDKALEQGKGIKVIELNGVTSEVTHIYDPRHGLSYAWSQLCRQWKLAFEIAEENVTAGHKPTPLRQFTRNLRRARRRQSHTQ